MPTISDKDGGIVTELRGQIGAIPVYHPGTGDGTSREYWQEQINITGTGDQTVHTVAAGKRFHVETLVLDVSSGTAAFRLKSGAGQNLSGVLRHTSNQLFSMTHGKDAPLRGKYADDNFIINSSGDNFAPYISGWVTGYDETV